MPASLSRAQREGKVTLTKTQKILREFHAQCRLSMARFSDRRADASERGDSEAALHYDTLVEAFSEIVENLETAIRAVVQVE
jgi:hypothetical protein